MATGAVDRSGLDGGGNGHHGTSLFLARTVCLAIRGAVASLSACLSVSLSLACLTACGEGSHLTRFDSREVGSNKEQELTSFCHLHSYLAEKWWGWEGIMITNAQ